MSNRFGFITVLAIGLCGWLFAFLFSACVGMSNDTNSPGIQMSFATTSAAVRTVILVSLVILSWFGAYAFTAVAPEAINLTRTPDAMVDLPAPTDLPARSPAQRQLDPVKPGFELHDD